MNATARTALLETAARTATEQASPVLLVPAAAIARTLSVSPRYVHLLGEQGKIPVCRFGKGCVRFSPSAVFAALGIDAA
ncbi:MAG: hypothetical protein WCO57_04890 [Verrucomicrobiota bacterium]